MSDVWRREHARRLCEYVHTRGYCPGLVAREIESMFYPRAAISPEMQSIIRLMLVLREKRCGRPPVLDADTVVELQNKGSGVGGR